MSVETESLEIFEGEIKNIVFSNDSGTFTVARVLRADGKVETVVGGLGGIQPGEFVKMEGRWIENQKFGKQFEVRSYWVHTPRTNTGLARYLAGGILPGVGPKTAERIVDRFGEETLDMLNDEPQRLHEVAGLGKNKVEKIIVSWQSHRQLHEAMVFLRSYNIGHAMAARIYRIYKERVVSVLKSNPYRLAWEVRGIGFKKADQIAQELGLAADSPERCEAAVIFFLKRAGDQGHVCYPLDNMIAEAQAMIEVSEDSIGRGIRRGIDGGRLVLTERRWQSPNGDDVWRGQVIYLHGLHQAEVGSAEELGRLITGSQDQDDQAVAEAGVREYCKKQSLTSSLLLGAEQIEALIMTLQAPVSVITGGPGTGKTTMIKALVKILHDRGDNVLLAAPTGRAAKRLTEATGEEAKTLHRLLEYRPHEHGFARNSENPLSCDALIVDETSMVDIFLVHHLLTAIASGSRVVFVGDIDQLPSVGSGNVLRDMIASDCLPVTRLTQIYRQSGGSLITLNAHSVNRGEFPNLVPFYGDDVEGEGQDFFFIKADRPSEIVGAIEKLLKNDLPRRHHVNVRDDVQVITPMHRGEVGSQNLNRVLQQVLNPKGQSVERGDALFRVDDRVMQTRNNYDKEVFNGDIGYIVAIDLEEGEVLVRFDFTDATYTLGELYEIELAYAVSVHKSQGSEYPVVIMPVSTSHFMMLQRNLLYTAITRGRMMVVLVGQSKAVALALKNNEIARRYGFLASRIREGVPGAPAAS